MPRREGPRSPMAFFSHRLNPLERFLVNDWVSQVLAMAGLPPRAHTRVNEERAPHGPRSKTDDRGERVPTTTTTVPWWFARRWRLATVVGPSG